MLADSRVVAMLATTRPDRARTFFADVLGLALIEEHDFALVFDAAGARLHVQKVEAFTPQPFTAVGWRVEDLRGAMTGLVAAGAKFERFDGMEQDGLGVWTPPGGTAGVCWFKDPDGNLLSLTQFA